MTAIWDLTAHAAREGLLHREISATELTRAVLDRIESVEPQVCAYLTVTAERALEQARVADTTLADGDPAATPALTGIPVAVKDVLCTRDTVTTCASRILEDFVPPYDATAVARLQAAGAVIVGKTNMDEFAMGSSTENSGYFPTHNPWDLDRVPGGSSGGSAAAVAAGECLVSLGTDTGGSIRQPAALCGVVGLKPTYGRVSRYGLVAFASSLDQIGPFGRDVEDCALLLQAIAGHDPLDATASAEAVPDFRAALTGDMRGVRVGVPKEYFIDGMEPDVVDLVRQAIDDLAALGAVLVDVTLPHTEYALATYYIIAPAECSANLARYNGVKYGLAATDESDMWRAMDLARERGFGTEVKRRIMLGTYALSAGYYDAYYRKAQQARTLIKQDFDTAFEQCDVVVGPTSPTTAFRLGEKTDDPLTMYLSDIFTIPTNIAGLPGLSVPCGFDAVGLPVGLQLIGRPFDEATLLRVAHTYEQSQTHYHARPAL
ncbi:MAG: Asp-tRNA(Asn)/Glu-tRNA(Gln) amidotransferase GatCAB subunit A [Dehalococcoidia bacterium]|nr:Asp-tRNA(Asn)/Glu-tRNA(Gln) amidotransferase GatCAB subunit A [Dehalococcoidia bacterium]